MTNLASSVFNQEEIIVDNFLEEVVEDSQPENRVS